MIGGACEWCSGVLSNKRCLLCGAFQCCGSTDAGHTCELRTKVRAMPRGKR
jgi:hypothetical protein